MNFNASDKITPRSTSEIFLVGQPSDSMPATQLPTKGDVLRYFHHRKKLKEMKGKIAETNILLLMFTRFLLKIKLKINKSTRIFLFGR